MIIIISCKANNNHNDSEKKKKSILTDSTPGLIGVIRYCYFIIMRFWFAYASSHDQIAYLEKKEQCNEMLLFN